MSAGQVVHFILEAVEQLPLSHFHVNHRGTGDAPYPPAMRLALLIYCYATGRFGSRTIEAATHSDVVVRVLCANRRAAGKKPRGPEPKPPSDIPEPKAQYNFTDPESGIMKAGNGQHFEQAYNPKAAVDGAMLIVGERVSDAPNDKQELPADVAAINPVVAAEVKAILVDSGFYSEAAVAAVEQRSDGTPTGVTVYAAVEQQSHQ